MQKPSSKIWLVLLAVAVLSVNGFFVAQNVLATFSAPSSLGGIDDATLWDIALSSSAVTLVPDFDASTPILDYTASVSNSTADITVNASANGALATIKINGVLVASGADSGAIVLSVGSNLITILVTAQDGITTNTYTVTVTRAGGAPVLHTDATLSGLTVNGATVAGFSASTMSYDVILSAGTVAIPTVAATVNDTGNATQIITQAPALPGSASVAVTAQDGATTKTYTINFTVALPAPVVPVPVIPVPVPVEVNSGGVGGLPSYLIVSSAGAGGMISPPGTAFVTHGASQEFNISANAGYQIGSVSIDGNAMGAVEAYAFSNVSGSHTISAEFNLIIAPASPAPTPEPTPIPVSEPAPSPVPPPASALTPQATDDNTVTVIASPPPAPKQLAVTPKPKPVKIAKVAPNEFNPQTLPEIEKIATATPQIPPSLATAALSESGISKFLNQKLLLALLILLLLALAGWWATRKYFVNKNY